MSSGYQSLLSRLPQRRLPPLNRLVLIGGASFLIVILLLPFFSPPVAETLSAGTSSVTSYWHGTQDWSARNASDGALRSHGRKDNFRENLRPELKYLMSGFHSGWTNDVMMGANAIHLALLTGRIPIIFPFPPSLHLRYIDDEAHIPPSIPFDTVFDLKRLSKDLKIPIVQMSELKTRIETKPLLGETMDTVHPVQEEIGGYSIWMITNGNFYIREGQTEPQDGEANGRRCYQLDTYRIQPYFIPVPPTFRPAKEWHATAFRDLVALFQPSPNPFRDYYFSVVPEWFKARNREMPKLMPEDHVLYIDFLYNLGEGGDDGRIDWTGKGELGSVGAWETVGKHMRWDPKLEEMSKGYLRRAFGVRDSKGFKVPDFISVHIRRNDIGNICADLTPEEMANAVEKNCYVSLKAYADRVDEVKAELAQKRGIYPKHVLATTDEHGEEFLAEVRELGWTMIDHDAEETVERNGLWYPTLIDSVILSMGTGFVGTSGSTMSILARRRVEEWNHGIGKQVSREYGGLPGDD